jgi:tetratricopeptide (TPR) repeat protein
MPSKRFGLQWFRKGDKSAQDDAVPENHDGPSDSHVALESVAPEAALDSNAGTSKDTAAKLVTTARTTARQGDVDEARRLLRAAVEADPGCVEGWLGLAWLAESTDERKENLERVLALDPDHSKARAELARLETLSSESDQEKSARPEDSPGVPAPEKQDSVSATSSRRRWVPYLAWGALAVLAVLLLVWVLVWGPVDSSLASLLATPTPTAIPTPTLMPSEIAAQFEPQLESALETGSWDRALEINAIMESVDPSGEAVDQWALRTRMEYGQALVDDGRAYLGLMQFDEAVALAPTDPEALLWQETTEAYLAGEKAVVEDQWGAAIQSYTMAFEKIPTYADVFSRLVASYRGQGITAIEEGKWTLAIESLIQADKRLPDDPETLDLLADAYRQRGIDWQEKNKLKKARADLETTLDMRPEDAKAQKHLDEVMYKLFPPKRVEINISRQRLYGYEGDNMVFNWAVSTGLPGRDTAAGHFQVLSKIPMAYSYIWSLSMPYWLGIYYVGHVENGIHALPIRPNGTVMWGGLLGQKASYGCIILNNQNAKTLYNWVEIGTKVDIHY